MEEIGERLPFAVVLLAGLAGFEMVSLFATTDRGFRVPCLAQGGPYFAADQFENRVESSNGTLPNH